MDQFVKRRVSITIEEEREGDHQEFAPVVARVLRELADLTDSGCAGKTAREVYCRNGVIATIVEDDITGVCIPYRDSGVKGLRFQYVKDAKKPPRGRLDRKVTSAMTNAPLKNYGFTYELDGKEFAFAIVAESEEEARRRATAMSGAAFVGEVQESD